MSIMDMGVGTGLPPAAPEPAAVDAPIALGASTIQREVPEVPEAEKNLVSELCKWATKTKGLRAKTYAKMRRDMKFVRPGRQWANNRGMNEATDTDASMYSARYEANITQRHLQQRVAALYAKNPKIVAKRRKRMDFTLWDGDQKPLLEAIARASGNPGNPGDPMKGVPPTPPVPPMPTPEDMALFADVEQGMNRRQMLDRIAKTLEIIYTYFQQEGEPNFKLQAKQLIRRVVSCGVGFVQIGFQRLMGENAEIVNNIRDDSERLQYLQTLAADVKDGKLEDHQAEMEALKTGLQTLQGQVQIVLREGLVFDFPASTDIIVDMECTQLKGFIGAKRVAREYHYTKMQVKEIFKVDLGANYKQYEPTKTWEPADRGSIENNVACVWAIWDANTKQAYYVCDGYPAFLKPAGAAEVDVDGFFPFKVLSFNDVEDTTDIYPPSDVELVRPMQLEYNRAREGLREHRIANKPGYVTSKGMLDEESKKWLQNHDSSEIVELNIPPDSVKEIDKYLGVRPTAPIDEAVYDAEYIFVDFQRVSGDQSANLGGTSGSTATEASIAETSRVSSLQSCIDDLNDFLSALARAGGQILFAEMSPEQVKEIAGPGAVWPELSREEIAKEIYLEIEAGSSGRPNKALEIANMERLAPFIVQIPGLKRDWLLRQMMMRLDENVELEDAFDITLPSVIAQNTIDAAPTGAALAGGAEGAPSQVQPSTGDAATDPAQQGGKGGMNAIGVPNSLPGPKPDFPTLPTA